MVKKNKTPFRACTGFNTLGSILTVKLANLNATEFKPDKALLKLSLFFFQLQLYFSLYVFYCKHDQGSNTKQISQFGCIIHIYKVFQTYFRALKFILRLFQAILISKFFLGHRLMHSTSTSMNLILLIPYLINFTNLTGLLKVCFPIHQVACLLFLGYISELQL